MDPLDPQRGFQAAGTTPSLNDVMTSSRYSDPLTAAAPEAATPLVQNVSSYSPVPAGYVPAADAHTGDAALRFLCELLNAHHGIRVNHAAEVGVTRWADIQQLADDELRSRAEGYCDFLTFDALSLVPESASWPSSPAARLVVGVATVCAHRLRSAAATPDDAAVLEAAGLTDAQAIALTLYTHPALPVAGGGAAFTFHGTLNHVLAERGAAAVSFAAKEPLLALYQALHVAISRLSAAWQRRGGAYPHRLFRGCRRPTEVDLEADFVLHCVRSWTQFTSLTSRFDVARDFARRDPAAGSGTSGVATMPVMLDVLVPPPSTGGGTGAKIVLAPAALLSVLPLEQEWVAMPNTTYIPHKVSGRWSNIPRVHVTLGPVASDISTANRGGADDGDAVVSMAELTAAARRPRRLYQVQPGDFVSHIAVAFDVTESDLVECNPRLQANKNHLLAFSYLELPQHARVVSSVEQVRAVAEGTRGASNNVVVNQPRREHATGAAAADTNDARLDETIALRLALDALANSPGTPVCLDAAQRQVVLAAFKAARASTPTEANGIVAVHKVRRGQTLSHVAREFGFTNLVKGAHAIAAVNPKLNGNINFVGEGWFLAIPAAPPERNRPPPTSVRSGESGGDAAGE